MKSFALLSVTFAILLGACASAARPAPRGLTVFAAASLTDAFKEIGAAFEAAHPGVKLTFSFAGSQTLRTQIEQGAQADIFASANTKEMNALVMDRYVIAAAPRAFLTNRLVVIMPPSNPAGLQSLEDLAKPGLKIVLAGEDVPAGSYARQALVLMDARFGGGYEARVLKNVVSNEEDVKQAVAKIQLGEADAAIVYGSDAVAAPGLRTIAIPAELNVVAKYPIAALTKSAQPGLAAAFIAYVLSPEGQAILQKWGFSPAA